MWRDLGRQAGTRTVGLRRIEIAEGHFSTPAHEHGADEEIFFVLGGEGLLWQDGETCAVAGGDCIVHRPKRGAHTLRAGVGGLDVLVFGQRRDPALTALPRAGVAWSFPRWVELGDGRLAVRARGRLRAPGVPAAERRATAPTWSRWRTWRRSSTVAPVAWARPRARPRPASTTSSCTAAGRARRPTATPRRRRSSSMLEGGGVLELWGRGASSARGAPVARRGDVVSRPAGTGVAHALRPGADGLTYLAYGTREHTDMCFYPQSGRVSMRGLGHRAALSRDRAPAGPLKPACEAARRAPP